MAQKGRLPRPSTPPTFNGRNAGYDTTATSSSKNAGDQSATYIPNSNRHSESITHRAQNTRKHARTSRADLDRRKHTSNLTLLRNFKNMRTMWPTKRERSTTSKGESKVAYAEARSIGIRTEPPSSRTKFATSGRIRSKVIDSHFKINTNLSNQIRTSNYELPIPIKSTRNLILT